MNTEELEKLVYENCDTKECGGKFYVISGDGIKDCKCFSKLIKYNSYNTVGIPSEFWKFDVDDIEKGFDKNIIKKYEYFRDNVETCILNKVQFWFNGLNGLGKTTISMLMLKDVIDKGYKGKVLNGFEVINYLYTDREDELEPLDFFVIDEFDKVKKSTIDDFCNLVTRYMDKKSLIFSGNRSIEELRNIGYPEFFIDRLHLLTKIDFKGQSYRKKIKSKFETLMGD
jgi:DNA replication protein DnaC